MSSHIRNAPAPAPAQSAMSLDEQIFNANQHGKIEAACRQWLDELQRTRQPLPSDVRASLQRAQLAAPKGRGVRLRDIDYCR